MSARSSCTSTEPARFLPRRIVLSIMMAVLLVHVGWAIAQQPDPFTPPQAQPAEGQQPIDIADLLGSESRAANDALEAGQRLVDEERHEEASEQFTTAVTEDANFVMAHYELGRALVQLERPQEAVEHFSTAVVLAPNYVPGHFERGKAFVELESYSLAINSFDNAEFYARNSPEILPDIFNQRGLARLELGELRDGQFQSAVNDFSRAVEQQPGNVEFLANLGSALVKHGSELIQLQDMQAAATNYTAAVETLDRALEDEQAEFETKAQAYYDRGLAKRSLGETEEAIEDIKRAVALDAENVDYTERLGLTYWDFANQELVRHPEEIEKIRSYLMTAIENFTKAIAGERDEDEDEPFGLYLSLAAANIRLADHTTEPEERNKHYLAAIKASTDCMDLDPPSSTAAPTLFNQGLAYRMMNDYRAATDSLTEALTWIPGQTEFLLRRGIVWYYRQEFDLAMSDLREAAEQREDARSMFWIGLVHAQQDQLEEAVQAYSEAVRRTPNFMVAYKNRGLAYLHMDEYKLAIDDFNQLIRHDHTDAVAYYRRGIAQELLEQQDRAVASYQAAVAEDAFYAPAHLRLAGIFEQRGEADKAREHSEQAKTPSPPMPPK